MTQTNTTERMTNRAQATQFINLAAFMQRFLACVLVIVALTLVGGHCDEAFAQTIDSTRVSAGARSGISYTLRAGDILRMRIWREPDLSGDYAVDENSTVTLPMIGAVSVAHETRESLHSKLVAAYGRSIENLSLDLLFLRRLAVTGAVKTPGLYPVDPTMTVGDAVALAGGSIVEAHRTKIDLMRSGKVFIADLDPAALVTQLPMERGDQLYVPSQQGFVERNPWVPSLLLQITAAAVTIVSILHR